MHKFKVGDYVRVVSGLESHERWGRGQKHDSDIWGTTNCWAPSMDEAVGRCFSVRHLESSGYRLCFTCSRGTGYVFPECCLELAEKPEVSDNPREVLLWV